MPPTIVSMIIITKKPKKLASTTCPNVIPPPPVSDMVITFSFDISSISGHSCGKGENPEIKNTALKNNKNVRIVRALIINPHPFYSVFLRIIEYYIIIVSHEIYVVLR
jgi:hypothetical protein